MSNSALLALPATGLLAACSSAHNELKESPASHAPVAHNTIVDCPVYGGMKKRPPS